MIESTIFDSCSSTSEGGSLYFNQGECIQKQVCYYNSKSSSSSHVYHSAVTAGQRNFILLAGIQSCGEYEHNYGLNLNNGFIKIDNVNISNNLGISYPIYSINNAESGSFFQFTTFMSNIQKNQGAFAHYAGIDLKIISCNYIKNSGLSNPISVLLDIHPTSNLENCCLLLNNCNTIFYVDAGKTLYVKNCYYDESTTSGGNIQFISPKTNSNTIELSHINLGKCYWKTKQMKCYDSCNENQPYNNLNGIFIKSIFVAIYVY